jgi:hypothetical protein
MASLVGTLWTMKVFDPPLGGRPRKRGADSRGAACMEHPIGRKLVTFAYKGRMHNLQPGEVVLVLEENVPLDVGSCEYPDAVGADERRQTYVKAVVRGQTWYMNRSYFNADSLWLQRV